MQPVLLLTCCLLFNLFGTNNGDFSFLILHNNDIHGRFEQTSVSSGECHARERAANKCVGGFGRLVHEVRRYRQLAGTGDGRPVLFLNAGDIYTGTAWFAVHKWKICSEFLNLLQPDVISLGNHEFDQGPAGLTPFLDSLKVPVVTANLNFKTEKHLSDKIKKSIILNVNDQRVGVIGYLTEETRILSSPEPVEFLDLIESIRAESESLDRQGVRIIIALGHAGYQADQEIAARVPLVDIVIGGHTNTFLWNGPAPSTEKPAGPYPKVVTKRDNGAKRVPVVQAYAYTKYLGRLNVTFNDNGDLIAFEGQPEMLDNTIPEDEDALRILEKYRPGVLNLTKQIIGTSQVVLDASMCRSSECNFGNLVADAFVLYATTANVILPGASNVSKTQQGHWSDVPIGFLNGGGIRATITPQASHKIKRSELIGALPFSCSIVTMKLSGADLLRTLETSVRSNGETSHGEFLQVSGIHVEYDIRKPIGHRVSSVSVRCGNCSVPVYEPLNPSATYSLVTNDFIANGGDGYEVLATGGYERKILDLNDLDVVDWYFKSQSPVYPTIEGRITFIESGSGGKGGAYSHVGALSTLVLVIINIVIVFYV